MRGAGSDVSAAGPADDGATGGEGPGGRSHPMSTTVVEAPGTATTGRMSLGTKALLLGAPLLMAVARVLLVPMDDQDWGGTMTSMAAHKARSDAGWILAVAACGLLAVTAGILARRLRAAGKPRSAVFAMLTITVGWAATAAICVGGLFLAVAATAPDRAAQIALQKDFNDGSSAFVFLMCAIGAIGYIVVAVGLARGSAISKGAAVLIGLGGAATIMTMPGPLKPLLVLTALLLAAGHLPAFPGLEVSEIV